MLDYFKQEQSFLTLFQDMCDIGEKENKKFHKHPLYITKEI